ncbi:MAG TPA: divalent-cation tolerance protein CutA [Verrucomicrobiae bacterium]|nr:divalent-cation tolerance protein CutA [Verrucomicrobiae bacterium]
MNATLLVVLVTAPNLRVARRLARAALKARLAACANLVPGIESQYHWQGKIESAKEVLLVLKTTRPCVKALERLLLGLHPYDTPEFVVLPVQSAARKYRDWWCQALAR